MNPELQRNLWLQFTPGRLLLAPVFLGLVLTSVWIVSFRVYGAVGLLAQWSYYAIALLWGTRRAADLVAEEVAARTWDAQRMSSLGAWQMTWGKLLGGTSYVWYAAVLALAAQVWARWLDGSPPWQPGEATILAKMLGLGLLAQVASFLAGLVLLRKQTLRRRLGTTASQAAGLLAAATLSGWIPAGISFSARGPVEWFVWTLDHDAFWLASVALFLAWSVFGAYRLMRLELQFRNLPIGWIGFALFLIGYVEGLLYPAVSRFEGLAPWLLGPFAVALALTYVALFAEPKDVLRYRWFFRALAEGELGRAFSLLPQWLPCFLLAAVGGLLLFILGDFRDISAVMALASHLPIFAAFSQGADIALLCFAMVLYLLRDALFVLAANFGARRGHADVAAFFCLVLAYSPVPVILRDVGLGALVPLFAPYPLASGLVNIAVPLIEAAVLAWLIRTRLQAAGRFVAAST